MRSTSPSVAAGGFSSSTSRPASSAFTAIAVRTEGGTHSATAASGPSFRKASMSLKFGTPVDRLVPRHPRRQHEVRVRRDRRQVLVPRDLADPDDGNRPRHQCDSRATALPRQPTRKSMSAPVSAPFTWS